MYVSNSVAKSKYNWDHPSQPQTLVVRPRVYLVHLSSSNPRTLYINLQKYWLLYWITSPWPGSEDISWVSRYLSFTFYQIKRKVVSLLRSVEACDDCVGRNSRLSFLAMVACRGGFTAESSV